MKKNNPQPPSHEPLIRAKRGTNVMTNVKIQMISLRSLRATPDAANKSKKPQSLNGSNCLLISHLRFKDLFGFCLPGRSYHKVAKTGNWGFGFITHHQSLITQALLAVIARVTSYEVKE